MNSFTETQQDYEKMGLERMDKYRGELKRLNHSPDELLELVARFHAKADILEEICDSLAAKNDNLEIALSYNPEIEVKEIITPTMIKMYRSGANKMYLEVKEQQKKYSAKGGDKKKENSKEIKDFIRECWNEWQLDLGKYKDVTAFAKDMLDKQETFVNQNVIVRWCKKWREESLC